MVSGWSVLERPEWLTKPLWTAPVCWPQALYNATTVEMEAKMAACHCSSPLSVKMLCIASSRFTCSGVIIQRDSCSLVIHYGVTRFARCITLGPHTSVIIWRGPLPSLMTQDIMAAGCIAQADKAVNPHCRLGSRKNKGLIPAIEVILSVIMQAIFAEPFHFQTKGQFLVTPALAEFGHWYLQHLAASVTVLQHANKLDWLRENRSNSCRKAVWMSNMFSMDKYGIWFGRWRSRGKKGSAVRSDRDGRSSLVSLVDWLLPGIPRKLAH